MPAALGLWAAFQVVGFIPAEAQVASPDAAGEARSLASSWSPYVNAWPDSTGLGLYVSVGQSGQIITPVTGLVDVPGSGPTGYKESHTLQFSGVSDGLETFAYLFANAFDSPTQTFAGAVTISATGSSTSPLQIGPLNFRRYPLPADQATDLVSADGLLLLHLEADSLETGAYSVVMPAGAPPGPLPFNHAVAGPIYNVRTSGAVVTITQPAVLWMYYTLDTLGSLDPDALHIYWWNGVDLGWVDLGGTHLADQQAVLTTVDRFGVYALLGPRGPTYTVYLPLIQK